MKSYYATTVFIAVGCLAAIAAGQQQYCNPNGMLPTFQKRPTILHYGGGSETMGTRAGQMETQTVLNEDGSTSFQVLVTNYEGKILNITKVRIGVWPTCDGTTVPLGPGKFQINLADDEIDQGNWRFQIPVTSMPIPNCLSEDKFCMVVALGGYVSTNEFVNLRLSSSYTNGNQCPAHTPQGPNGVTQCPIGVTWRENCESEGYYPVFKSWNYLTFPNGPEGDVFTANLRMESMLGPDGNTGLTVFITTQSPNFLKLTRARFGVWPNCNDGSVPNGGSKFQVSVTEDLIDQQDMAWRIATAGMPIPNCVNLRTFCFVGSFKAEVIDYLNTTVSRSLVISKQYTNGTQCKGGMGRGPNGVQQCAIGVDWQV
ncbi:hypothetical protein NDN08_000130 [Rhodosorus marinus]|uniref:Pherophorin domain-containing protein n=1 Tax=Rhodosorus marinus TaxID=101924 RepID=A0AAV8UEG0_9RHOD|nr:hypothetical protein NDN08_000130 [Rhodosorus marinus]